MEIEPDVVLKIKNSLRIKHNALDEDIGDTIQAAMDDLRLCGIIVRNAEETGELDPIIMNAVKLFCKVEYTDDLGKSAEFQRRYDSLKSCLMMSEKYREAPADE